MAPPDCALFECSKPRRNRPRTAANWCIWQTWGKKSQLPRGNRKGMTEFNCIAPDVKLGSGVRLAKFINLYGCTVGDDTKIGAFVEIQKNATIGKRCKI